MHRGKDALSLCGRSGADRAPARRVVFCLWLRNPSWSRATHVVCAGAEVRLVGGFWQVRKEWSDGDKVAIRFDQAIRELPAVNGEIALQYGPLLYVLPVRGTTKTVKAYPRAGLADYLMSADKDAETKLALPAWQRANGFGFTPKNTSASGVNPDLPLDNPPVELGGKLVRELDGTLVPVRLVPMGAQSRPSTACDVSRDRLGKEVILPRPPTSAFEQPGKVTMKTIVVSQPYSTVYSLCGSLIRYSCRL